MAALQNIDIVANVITLMEANAALVAACPGGFAVDFMSLSSSFPRCFIEDNSDQNEREYSYGAIKVRAQFLIHIQAEDRQSAFDVWKAMQPVLDEYGLRSQFGNPRIERIETPTRSSGIEFIHELTVQYATTLTFAR